MDLVIGRHKSPAARMVARDGLLALPVGLLQRTDDDVPAGTWIRDSSAARRGVECLEADYVRIRRIALHRLVCAVVCASIFAGVVRLPWKTRSLRGLLQELDQGYSSA